MIYGWFKIDGRIGRPEQGVDLYHDTVRYLSDEQLAVVYGAGCGDWVRALTDAELAALPAAHYRCVAAWRNGRQMLLPGTQYLLDADFAAQVMRDSPDVLVPMSPAEVEQLRAALSYAEVATGTAMNAPGPHVDTLAATRGLNGGGDGAMSTADMFGGGR